MALGTRPWIEVANPFAMSTIAWRLRRFFVISNVATPGYRVRKPTMLATSDPRHC